MECRSSDASSERVGVSPLRAPCRRRAGVSWTSTQVSASLVEPSRWRIAIDDFSASRSRSVGPSTRAAEQYVRIDP